MPVWSYIGQFLCMKFGKNALYHVVVTGYRSEWLFPGQGVKFSGKSTCPNNISVIKIGKNECVSKNKILVGRKWRSDITPVFREITLDDAWDVFWPGEFVIDCKTEKLCRMNLINRSVMNENGWCGSDCGSILKTKFSFGWVYRYLKLALKTRINFAKFNIEDIKQCWKVKCENKIVVS